MFKKDLKVFFSFLCIYFNGDIVDNNKHEINIIQRKNITISGVKKVENFDKKEFMLNTNMGYLKINGSDLEIVKLDTDKGDLSIKGKIDSMNYLDGNKNKESIISKLFK